MSTRQLSRRIRLGSSLCLIGAIALSLATPAGGQAYPSKPVRMIVPYSAGGGTDIFARMIARKLSERWNQQVIVENRTGAGGIVGTEAVAQAPADGYTLLVMANTHALYPSFYKSVPFDPVNSFSPITLVASGANVLVVHPSLPASSVRDLIGLAKQRPGQLTFASAGKGSTTHLAGELFKSMAKIDVVHIPYKGSGQAEVDVAGGHVAYMIDSLPAALPNIKAGRTRALATTDRKRAAALPDVPTIDESGLAGYEITTWWGIAASANTPAALVSRLSKDIGEVMGLPDVKELLASQGAEPRTSTPEEFASYIRSQIDVYRRIISDAGIKPE
jgi:tripartite-type tricarboxylate transporter receptor subunit TctC